MRSASRRPSDGRHPVNRRRLLHLGVAMVGAYVAAGCGFTRLGARADDNGSAPPRVGFVNPGISTDPVNVAQAQAFIDALSVRGRVDGQTILLEWRYGEANLAHVPELAAALVRLPVQVLVARGAVAALAARNVTTELPIVMAGVDDPIS
jgi:hypothetical protein